MRQFRQGDVFLVRVNEVPEDAKPVERDNGRVVLAYGEVTGHAHAIEESHVTLLSRAENDRFLRIVGAAANLVHEEHSTIAIPPGTYRVVRQREWGDEDEPRMVAD